MIFVCSTNGWNYFFFLFFFLARQIFFPRRLDADDALPAGQRIQIANLSLHLHFVNDWVFCIFHGPMLLCCGCACVHLYWRANKPNEWICECLCAACEYWYSIIRFVNWWRWHDGWLCMEYAIGWWPVMALIDWYWANWIHVTFIRYWLSPSFPTHIHIHYILYYMYTM